MCEESFIILLLNLSFVSGPESLGYDLQKFFSPFAETGRLEGTGVDELDFPELDKALIR